MKKSPGYWKPWENVKAELDSIIDMEVRDNEGNLLKVKGEFPTNAVLRFLGRYGLSGAIHKYHGGINAVRQKMGFDKIDFSSRGKYINSRGRKSEVVIISILKEFADIYGLPFKERKKRVIQIGPQQYIEFLCGKDKIIGVDITNTVSYHVVSDKWKQKKYHKYVDYLWIVVLSTKLGDKKYREWNRESPDNVIVIDARKLEDFLNSLSGTGHNFIIPPKKKKMIEALAKCTFANKEEVLKNYNIPSKEKKQAKLKKFFQDN
ncbi:MAG: hypothetical protein ACTSO9_06880 [Candidatus Helarchaeota archaeon]